MCLGINLNNFNPQILYVCRIEDIRKAYIKYHCHDSIEFSYVLSGKGIYSINNKVYEVKAGDLICFNPGVYHSEIVQEDTEIDELHIGFNNFYMKNVKKNCILEENSFQIITLTQYKEEFLQCCNEIIVEQQKNNSGYDFILKALVMKLIILMLRETYCNNEKIGVNKCNFESTEKSIVANTIIDYMNENYMKDISLDKISKNMYLSPVYISKIFKEETGESPINYLINIRLEKAKYLLNQETMTIKSVAKSVGYDDPYYFSKLFKKYYGFSPTEYKQLNIV